MAKGSQNRAVTPRRTIEFEDQEFSVAVVTRGRQTTEAEKIEIADVVCMMYATDQFSLSDCLEQCGISPATWVAWKRQVKQIEFAYIDAQKTKDAIYRTRLRHRARTMAERMIDGMTIELTEREAEQGVDEDGNPALFTTRIKRKEVYVRPSVKLIETVLFNMDPVNFEKNPLPVEQINKEVDIPPIDWVD